MASRMKSPLSLPQKKRTAMAPRKPTQNTTTAGTTQRGSRRSSDGATSDLLGRRHRLGVGDASTGRPRRRPAASVDRRPVDATPSTGRRPRHPAATRAPADTAPSVATRRVGHGGGLGLDGRDAGRGCSASASSPRDGRGDRVELQPAGHQPQLLDERPGRGRGVDAGLDVGALHAQHAGGAVGLQVDAPDEAVAEQVRQHVVAVDPLRRRRVDLDAVVEVEQPLVAVAVPDQRVERAEQRPGVDRPRHLGVAVDVRRLGPALDRRPGAARPPRRARRRAAGTASCRWRW